MNWKDFGEEDLMNSTEDYFGSNDLALHAWISKYQHNNETLDEFFDRIASEFVRLDNFKQDSGDLTDAQWEALSDYGKERFSIEDRYKFFLHLFKDFKHIIPGGSVLSGIGSGKPISLSNCYVISTGDSIEEILKARRRDLRKAKSDVEDIAKQIRKEQSRQVECDETLPAQRDDLLDLLKENEKQEKEKADINNSDKSG